VNTLNQLSSFIGRRLAFYDATFRILIAAKLYILLYLYLLQYFFINFIIQYNTLLIFLSYFAWFVLLYSYFTIGEIKQNFLLKRITYFVSTASGEENG